jgi:hypothetical protein
MPDGVDWLNIFWCNFDLKKCYQNVKKIFSALGSGLRDIEMLIKLWIFNKVLKCHLFRKLKIRKVVKSNGTTESVIRK